MERPHQKGFRITARPSGHQALDVRFNGLGRLPRRAFADGTPNERIAGESEQIADDQQTIREGIRRAVAVHVQSAACASKIGLYIRSRHARRAIAALEAGKPALLQKPMARNSAECRAIIAAAQATGVPLFVSFMHRYLEEIEQVRPLLERGVLGRVHSVRQRNATPGADWAAWFYRKENVGGGVLLQLGVHGIDLLRHLFGEIVRVRATTALMIKERMLADGTVVRPNAEDLVIATYEFASGLIAAHESASVSYTHLRAHETVLDLVCRLLLEKKKQETTYHPH